MSEYSEEAIQNAIVDAAAGKSIRQAAAQWGIPRATIQRRINGAKTRLEVSEATQRLSGRQEDNLAKWLLAQAALSMPATHQQLRRFAEHILAKGNDHRPLGKNWVAGFLRRHPEIATSKGKRMDSCRINRASADTIKAFFTLLRQQAIQNIRPANWYNMDETGLQMGQGSNGLVLGSSQTRAIQRKQPGSRC